MKLRLVFILICLAGIAPAVDPQLLDLVMPDAQAMAGAHQPACHRRAHDAGSDPGDVHGEERTP